MTPRLCGEALYVHSKAFKVISRLRIWDKVDNEKYSVWREHDSIHSKFIEDRESAGHCAGLSSQIGY